jgi:hypothetical protein
LDISAVQPFEVKEKYGVQEKYLFVVFAGAALDRHSLGAAESDIGAGVEPGDRKG